MSESLVIVGNGMAATRLVDEVTARAPGKYAIAVVGQEPSLAYNRVLLSSLLAGDIEDYALELKPASWWAARGVTLVYGRPATSIDTASRKVVLEGGATLAFSKLVIATGSDAFRLKLPGADLPGVMTFRDRADVSAMLTRAGSSLRAVVIGGGLLGLEAAYGLAKAGADVTIIHLMDRLMERQLDVNAASILKREMESRGIKVEVSAESEAIEGTDKVTGLRLKDGRVIGADIVVMAVGISPNVALARAAGIGVKRGIAVDDKLETSVPGIHAIGECAEHRGTCYGLVEPAYEQARVLADQLIGGTSHYAGSLLATNLKVSGVSVFSAGDFLGEPGTEHVTLNGSATRMYRKLVIKDDRLAGAVLVGETGDALWYLDLIRSGRPLGAMRDWVVFGRAYSEPQQAAA